MARTILLICEYASINGGERSILATLGGVRRAGFDLVAAAPPEGPLADEFQRREVELIPLGEAGAALGARRERLAEILRGRRFDLLHANSLAMGRLSGPVARAARVPSLSHLRDIVGLSRQALADLACHRRLLAVSRATRDFHVSAGLAPEKVHVLYNGVDLEEFQPRSATGFVHRELGIAPGCLLAGSIGQIGLRKGHDVLLAAAAQLFGPWPNLHWLLVGCRYSDKEESRRYEASLRQAAENLGGRFHFLGRRSDVPRLLNELTLLVHSARQEPLGRVLLEAAASGLPVVATDVGGTREIFPVTESPFAPRKQPAFRSSEGDAGALLVRPDDAAALSTAISHLLSDETARRRQAAAARRHAETHFSVARAAAGLVAHYEGVLSG